MLGEEAWQRGRAAFLLALEQHSDSNRQLARDRLPGARRLEKGHQLTLVVLRAARDDNFAVAFLIRNARLKRRRLPQVQRIGRLHIVVAVEQHVRHVLRPDLSVMRDDHRVAGGFHDLRLGKTNCLQFALAPFGSGLAVRLEGWIGRDAGNPQEIE